MALLRHLTNSKIMGTAVQTQQQAWETYEKLIADPRVSFATEPANLEVSFRAMTQAASPSHSRWTDAYLASFAIAGGFELVTLEKNFRRTDGLMLFILTPSNE